jgi:5,10-methylene-tetrahydrofolate dehydrogenase/methenyl tetrahydrofolate cyclohydrolase
MLRTAGADVTVAHSKTSVEKLEDMVRSSGVVVACGGLPALLKADWVKPGADVVNVGTTFMEEKDSLVSDFEGDLSAVAGRFSPVMCGIGPLSVAALCRNVATAAWNREGN